MSRRKKQKSDSPMPATGAGLIRFYSEADSPGIKIQAYATVAYAIILIIAIGLAHVIF